MVEFSFIILYDHIYHFKHKKVLKNGFLRKL